MSNPQIDLVIQAGTWPRIDKITMLVEKSVRTAIDIAILPLPDGAELSIVLSDDAHVQGLNKQWRKINRPTNVLSFPSAEIESGGRPDALMGDIVFALETIEREAVEQDKSFDDHLTHLVIHGFLHIYGYDHDNDKDAETMEALEQHCMEALGLPDPYDADV